jgi:ComF family protein
MRSVAPHTLALRHAVHALKYEGLRVLSEPLGTLLAACWQAQGITVDLVLPVPLSRARERERGYNQSALLARAMAGQLALPCPGRLLVRQRNTRSQVGLSAQERWDNVWGAFACHSAELGGQRVLLVDDVLTTGATLQACAAALRQAGASEVWALTLTRAMGDT